MTENRKRFGMRLGVVCDCGERIFRGVHQLGSGTVTGGGGVSAFRCIFAMSS